jgi:hypothetical protein
LPPPTYAPLDCICHLLRGDRIQTPTTTHFIFQAPLGGTGKRREKGGRYSEQIFAEWHLNSWRKLSDGECEHQADAPQTSHTVFYYECTLRVLGKYDVKKDGDFEVKVETEGGVCLRGGGGGRRVLQIWRFATSGEWRVFRGRAWRGVAHDKDTGTRGGAASQGWEHRGGVGPEGRQDPAL